MEIAVGAFELPRLGKRPETHATSRARLVRGHCWTSAMRPAARPSTTVEDVGTFAEGEPVGRAVWARTVSTDQQTAAVRAPPAKLCLRGESTVLHVIRIRTCLEFPKSY